MNPNDLTPLPPDAPSRTFEMVNGIWVRADSAQAESLPQS